MTYTQFVSTMNHLYMSKGPKGLVDYWFNSVYTGYCIGLLEYCCNTLRMKMKIMCETIGEVWSGSFDRDCSGWWCGHSHQLHFLTGIGLFR